jgi:hypothetical protein
MLSTCRRCERWLPYTLAFLLALPPSAAAQTPAGQPQTAASVQPDSIRSLKILPLAGNQALNDLENKIMAPLVVQVLDQSDRPVEGAEVVFRFPVQGPSASFQGDRNFQAFRTNADGQASAIGWMANGSVGTFQVQVTASRGNEQGSTAISMTNATRITDQLKKQKKSWWSSRTAKILYVVGAAGVVAAIVLATRGGSSGPTVITATPGSPTIGAPQ